MGLKMAVRPKLVTFLHTWFLHLLWLYRKMIHSRPIGSSIRQKKSGWNGSLTLSLDGGDKKEFQTNRIQAQCSRAALQSHCAASGL